MQRFDSKKDFLLAFILIAIAIVCTLAALDALPSTTDAGAYLLFAVIGIMGVVLPLWLLTSTYYLVDDATLQVKSGPFRWSVKLAEITAVKPSNSPLASPALSFDRLEIHYTNGKQLLVSPKDKQAFISALQR